MIRVIRRTGCLDYHESVGKALVDPYGRVHRYLRVSVTDRCNFRCRYCMPERGVEWKARDEVLSFEEIVSLTRLLTGLGVEKVRLTGGEPTVRKNLPDLASRLSALDGLKTLAMTTNGTTLADRATQYRDAGISALNVSLDSLDPRRFEEITLRPGLDRVLRGIEAAIAAGFPSIKINVVVLGGVNDHEAVAFAGLAKDWPVTVRFIEFMPFLGNQWSHATLVPTRETKAAIQRHYKLNPVHQSPNEVSRDFSIDGFAGQVGFVSSMTESFCGGCDRLRLSATGALSNCLFSQAGTDLRTPLRNGATEEDLADLVRSELAAKWREHPPMDHLARLSKREMVAIGG